MKRPRLLRRERALLALVREHAGTIGARGIQPLLHGYCRHLQGLGEAPPYDFLALPAGPRSLTAEADLERLARRGLLARTRVWRLTRQGRAAAGSPRCSDLAGFLPHSCTDPAPILHRIDADPAPLSTIGYERRSWEGFFGRLLSAGATLLCDVRRNPASRRWGFSGKGLRKGCGLLDMRYEHLPQLGIAASARAGLNGRDDRSVREGLLSRYEASLAGLRAPVGRIAAWTAAGERVALACYEREARDCHRSRLAGAVARAAGLNGGVRHL